MYFDGRSVVDRRSKSFIKSMKPLSVASIVSIVPNVWLVKYHDRESDPVLIDDTLTLNCTFSPLHPRTYLTQHRTKKTWKGNMNANVLSPRKLEHREARQ